MPAFELVRSGEITRAAATTFTRALFVPDLEGNWRELRIGTRCDVRPSASRTDAAGFFARRAA